jgi:hypothetical protein
MRKSSVLLVFVSVACALSAAWSWWELRGARTQIANLEQRLAASSAPQIQPTSSPPTEVRIVPAVPTASAPTVTAEIDPEEARQKEVRERLRAAQQYQREMLRDPAYRKTQVEEARRRFAHTRADAIRVVGMSPEQADRVIGLWVERNFRYTELVDWNKSPSEAAQAEMKRAGDAEQAELRDLLGAEKYDKWNWYLASEQERGEVGQFAVQLATTSEPLHDGQADALVETIYSERRQRSKEYEDYVKQMGITDRNMVSPQDRRRWLDLEIEANQRIHDTMAGTLSHAQLSRLDEMLAARLAPIEAALRMQLEGKVAKSN